MSKAVFVNRNLLLDQKIVGGQPRQPRRLGELKVAPESRELMDSLKKAGFRVFAFVHLPGITEGTLIRREIESMHCELVINRVPSLSGILVCPHNRDIDCECRPPKSGLFLEAVGKNHINHNNLYVMSDQADDLTAGAVVLCTRVAIASRSTDQCPASIRVSTVKDGVRAILADAKRRGI